MARVVRNWRLAAVQDHLDELESFIHDLKDLYEVVSDWELGSIDFRKRREDAYWNLAMIRELLSSEKRK